MSITLSDPKLKQKFVIATDMGEIIYTFPGYDTIVITGSQMICVQQDFCRIWDGTKAHLIPSSWLHMEWEVKDGGTAFKF